MTKAFDAYATCYDLLYQDKDYAGETDFVRELLRDNGIVRGDILELGCGTGKHAEMLARQGFSIHGVDMSPGMVKMAQTRNAKDLTNKLSFAVGDARSYRIDRTFNAIIALFHVASYQTTNEDISAIFQTAARHLLRGGIFLFDCWYGPAVLTDPPVVRVKRLGDEQIDVLRIAEPVMYPNENIVDVNYTVLIKDRRNDILETINETHRMRYFFVPELKLLAAQTEFEVVDTMQWLGGTLGFNSWSATIVARKQ